MRSRYRHVPQLEQLEDRWAPALVLQLDGFGNLTGVFGTPAAPGNVLLDFTATDEIEVFENGVSIGGPFSALGNLTVSLGNFVGTPTLDVELNGFDFSSAMRITVGNATGGWAVSIFNDGAGPSTIFGNVSVNTGNGPDILEIANELFTDAGTNLFGGLNFNMRAGDDTFHFNFFSAATSEIQGSIIGTGANNVEIGLIAPTLISGNVILNTSAENRSDTIAIRSTTDIGGSLLMTTGTEGAPGDNIIVQGLVGRDLLASMGGGANDILIDSTAIIGRNVTITSGNQDDDVTFASDSTVLGNITAIEGNGANTLLIDTGAFVGGSRITCYTGSGQDDVTFNGMAPGAFLNVNLGSGSDDFTLGSTVLSRGYIDYGAGIDSFIQIVLLIDIPWTNRNLP